MIRRCLVRVQWQNLLETAVVTDWLGAHARLEWAKAQPDFKSGDMVVIP